MNSCRLKIIFLAIGLANFSGCSVNNLGVEVWERDVLAKPQMALDDTPLTYALDDHIYFSKEASSGGASFAGGGCGCN
ncbi:MAG: DUF4266 domain-containing protein [Gammaproteobacteria bacterium]|nr:DUF4266 domain-containing protein [Gammaproteobacteria bacterium]